MTIKKGVDDMRAMKFGQRLKMLRVQNDLTQQEMAVAFGQKNHPTAITKGAISMYEIGKRIPETELLIKIADFFDVSVDYLLGLSEVTKRNGKEDEGK